METPAVEENSEQMPPTAEVDTKSPSTRDESGANGDEESKTEKNSNPEGLSKNQLKKLRRNQRWEEKKAGKRLMEREKKKQKRRLIVEAGNAPLAGSSMRKKLKKNKMQDSNCRVKAVIDCSFDDLMSEKDVNRTVSQIQYCYSSNRRAEHPMQLYVTSVDGATEKRLHNCGEFESWDVHFRREPYSEVFKKENIVYLSSDSDNVLQELDPEKAYIIGGLVDHNSQKGLCHRLAVEKGFSHAQLPIGEFIKLKSRKVLTINHVFEILLHVTEGKTWEEALNAAIPKRKIDSEEPDDSCEQAAEDGHVLEDKPSADAKGCESNSKGGELASNECDDSNVLEPPQVVSDNKDVS